MTARRERRWPGVEIPLACGWLLGLICFSLPGREGPESLDSIDIVALVKVLVRLGTLAVLATLLLACWRHPRRPVIMAALAPLGVFVAWAVASASWSALRAVTLGQTLGLIDLCLISATIGLLWKGPADTSKIVCHLACALLLFSAVVMVADFVSHDLSGLNRQDRSELENVSSGLVHPTTAGATSSLGLVLIIGAFFHGGWRWPTRLLVPGVAIHAAVLALAASRTALVMAVAVGGLFFLLRARPAAIATAAFGAALLGIGWLLFDPGMEATEQVTDLIAEKLSRGESAEQLSSLTGRTDLWDAMWASYADSPLKGHGYFVTSRSGEIDVWEGPSNHTAHNALLQVLVTTGAIGLVLFLIGFAWPLGMLARCFLRAPRGSALSKELALFLVLLACWYAGWGQLSESFMGPVQPESVVFFSLFGLALAHLDPALVAVPGHRRAPERAPAVARATP